MKELLDGVVFETESAFRLTSDNIMISNEVMHYLKRKKYGKDVYVALKLDICKAYGRIEWHFLREML